MMQKYASTMIKLGMTAVALLFVFSQVDMRQIAAKLTEAQLGWVLAAFMLVNASMVIRAYRWQLLLRALGAPVRFERLVSLYFAANFFNSVLPSGLTGDVIRVVEVARDVPAGAAAGTVIVDRTTGLLALFMLALLALPFRPAYFPASLLTQIMVLCAVGLVGGLVFLQGNLLRRLGGRVPAWLWPYWRKLDQVMAAVEGCGWRAIWAALGVSFIFNLMQIAWWWAAGRALGYAMPLTIYFYTTPLMALAFLLPSIGGLGIREYLASLLFVSAGLTPAEAVTLSLLVFAIERLSGLLGAPIYIYTVLRGSNGRQRSASPK